MPCFSNFQTFIISWHTDKELKLEVNFSKIEMNFQAKCRGSSFQFTYFSLISLLAPKRCQMSLISRGCPLFLSTRPTGYNNLNLLNFWIWPAWAITESSMPFSSKRFKWAGVRGLHVAFHFRDTPGIPWKLYLNSRPGCGCQLLAVEFF